MNEEKPRYINRGESVCAAGFCFNRRTNQYGYCVVHWAKLRPDAEPKIASRFPIASIAVAALAGGLASVLTHYLAF